MTYSDELRFEIDQVLALGREAVGNGAAAMEDNGIALQRIQSAIDLLTSSRVWALQELDQLRGMVNRTQQILQSSGNISAMNALGFFERTKQLVEDYVNKVQGRIDLLEQQKMIIEVNQRELQLDASGHSLKSGLEDLLLYRTQL